MLPFTSGQLCNAQHGCHNQHVHACAFSARMKRLHRVTQLGGGLMRLLRPGSFIVTNMCPLPSCKNKDWGVDNGKVNNCLVSAGAGHCVLLSPSIAPFFGRFECQFRTTVHDTLHRLAQNWLTESAGQNIYSHHRIKARNANIKSTELRVGLWIWKTTI